MEKTQGQLWDLRGEGVQNGEGQPHSTVGVARATLTPRREGLPFSSHRGASAQADLPCPQLPEGHRTDFGGSRGRWEGNTEEGRGSCSDRA